MATKTASEKVQPVTTVTAWADADAIEGADLTEKAELVGKPFLISGVWFRTNKETGVEYVTMEAEFENGETFEFQDASGRSGIKQQITEYLTKVGKFPKSDGEIVDIRLVIPRGLRKSTYTVKDERGRDREATTFYLTTSGRRSRA